jgi:hypothetical protein
MTQNEDISIFEKPLTITLAGLQAIEECLRELALYRQKFAFRDWRGSEAGYINHLMDLVQERKLSPEDALIDARQLALRFHD